MGILKSLRNIIELLLILMLVSVIFALIGSRLLSNDDSDPNDINLPYDPVKMILLFSIL